MLSRPRLFIFNSLKVKQIHFFARVAFTRLKNGTSLHFLHADVKSWQRYQIMDSPAFNWEHQQWRMT